MKNPNLKEYDKHFKQLFKELAALQTLIEKPEFQKAADRSNAQGGCYYQDFEALVDDLKNGLDFSSDSQDKSDEE